MTFPVLPQSVVEVLGVTDVGGEGAAFTVKVIIFEVTRQVALFNSTLYLAPFSLKRGLIMFSVAAVVPVYCAPSDIGGVQVVPPSVLFCHRYVDAFAVMLRLLFPDPSQNGAGSTGWMVITGRTFEATEGVATREVLIHPFELLAWA